LNTCAMALRVATKSLFKEMEKHRNNVSSHMRCGTAVTSVPVVFVRTKIVIALCNG